MADAPAAVLTQMVDTNNNGEEEEKEEGEKAAARNASRSVMHKILNVTAFFHAATREREQRGRNGGSRASVNEHAAYTYTFLITAHLYVDKRGLAALNKWASLNKLPCIMAYACGPVIPCRCGTR